MAKATIISGTVKSDGVFVNAAVRVEKDDSTGADVEYNVSTTLRDEQGNVKDNAQLRKELLSNVSNARNRQLQMRPLGQDMNISGSANI